MSVVMGPDNKEELISQWIVTYEKDLLRLCCVYLKDITLAEDAVQETFLKAYKSLDTFRGDSGERTWLVRIAINVCKDMCRSAWFRLLRNAVELDRCQIAEPEGKREIRSALVAEILHLPRVCREVVLLHYYEGYNKSETAEILGISNTTVQRRLEKAYKLLKNVLKGESFYEE